MSDKLIIKPSILDMCELALGHTLDTSNFSFFNNSPLKPICFLAHLS